MFLTVDLKTKQRIYVPLVQSVTLKGTKITVLTVRNQSITQWTSYFQTATMGKTLNMSIQTPQKGPLTTAL